MEKFVLNEHIYVVKTYIYAKPLIIQEFPSTLEGLSDAKLFVKILNKEEKRYGILIPSDLVLEDV